MRRAHKDFSTNFARLPSLDAAPRACGGVRGSCSAAVLWGCERMTEVALPSRHPADNDEGDLFGPRNTAYGQTPDVSPYPVPRPPGGAPAGLRAQQAQQAGGHAPPAAVVAGAAAAKGRGGGGGGGGRKRSQTEAVPRFDDAEAAATDAEAARRERIANLKRRRMAEAEANPHAGVQEIAAAAQAGSAGAVAVGAPAAALPQMPPAGAVHDPSAAAGLPSGWLDCPRYGEPLSAGPLVRLVPCKVPLHMERFGAALSASDAAGVLTPEGLVAEQRAMGRRVDLIVDLTNSSRYYDKAAVEQRCSVLCRKVPCVGRGAAPNPLAVNAFFWEIFKYAQALGAQWQEAMNAADADWMAATRQFNEQKRQAAEVAASEGREPPDLGAPPPKTPIPPPVGHVLVHCTHGFNRTGFMVVNTVLRMTQGPTRCTDVLRAFAKARPPGIYKPDYIAELYKALYQRRSPRLLCPEVPDWKPASPGRGDGGEGDAAGSEIQGSDDAAKPIEHDDVIGDPVPPEMALAMQQACCQLLDLPYRATPMFPGSQPVSLDAQNKRLLEQQPYTVTWKADGTRYMALLYSHGTYLIDRAFGVRRVTMRFLRRPSRSKPTPPGSVHDGTLLDGEMVVDVDPTTGKRQRRFLVYDLMALNGDSKVSKMPFYSARYAMIANELVAPRDAERMAGLKKGVEFFYDYAAEVHELFSVRRKDFWPVVKSRHVLTKFIKGLGHECDGVILQARDDEYRPHTCYHLLKWKYSSMNSVDFLLRRAPSGELTLHLLATGRDLAESGGEQLPRALDATPRFDHDENAGDALVGRIVECRLDLDSREWVYMRTRVDKDMPNAMSTFKRVMRSIEDGIEEEDFLRYVDALQAQGQ